MLQKELSKLHDKNEYGIWKITGENTSYGGMSDPNHYPNLGIVEGKWEDVVNYAISLKDFFSWGRGGTIDKVTIKKV